MEIDQDEAKIIIEMARVCASEGIGPAFDALLRRIEDAFDICIEDWIYR